MTWPRAARRDPSTGSAVNGGERGSGESAGLAPVIPLFGAQAPTAGEDDDTRRAVNPTAEQWHPTWVAGTDDALEADQAPSEEAELAEKALLKKLRTRSLSVSEARGVLRERHLDPDSSERILQSLEDYGYLDDAALAEQLLHAAVDRKGQGRQAIAQTLAKRGIARDVADAALASLPDDDLERALEFARSKARSMSSLDRDTALRRLTGQLARRGYGGSVAMTAARAALDEQGRPASGVRFR